ncbi:MAG: hypothetical protein A2268_14695 [Candidatus Raymondbacteria bacterium RifOxyA12_full_50_37]|uniref:Damage-control phosphatase ARMT1-like metal-binding domain-containing protein n=1 Tax=Candidatus Raymondbacteria bacterium RIFOXYD12_FULL_49_13 TaxID=1817890 RepID=A0A1F7F2F3_UNCRA|nr:MAG: hypothetical protein A2268_14695 [Candidatus Raymondbacteria bacterium RifOxyA12_full_50_37]OGJ87813.1 MAG: hypothetical protein A2350_12640 [Candidatus Raymondbacteria bacterium RifOxyB12_full_50_8]OGJ88667.1 MAG: hypothetical protein A2248_20630 [Candidatus Raymondbacteria bacterium RIFOXYA2_FULL_49_16]OGJ95977.1 MAG: hypothetical protein A2487_21105 [Candidatus Raymondbacteria bacterium RifOxyC12_full_50_8]OGK00839.1 MAG: hypothetical protein A2519_07885 [Candidatus Raymondbacteria b
MKSFIDCIPCFIDQTLGSVRSITDDTVLHEKILKKVLRVVSDLDMGDSPPAMGQKIHRIIREMTGNADPYQSNKERYNRFAESLMPMLKKKIDGRGDAFENGLRMAIAGNIIDFGKNHALTEDDVLKVINQCFSVLIDMDAVASLKEEVLCAKTILYLGDNAGEIVFDRFFIEQLPVEKITYVVRGRPIINDVTKVDAEEVNMNQLVRVADNGSDAPGTILSDCSPGFVERFHQADLIISKGQGNYETLSGMDNNIYFLLQAKCPVIARDIGCEIGAYIVRKNAISRIIEGNPKQGAANTK